MNLPATVKQPQLQNVVGKARIVVCRAAAASWSPSLGKSQPSAPHQKRLEPAEQLKSAEQPNQEVAVPAAEEVTPALRRSRPRYCPSVLCATTSSRSCPCYRVPLPSSTDDADGTDVRVMHAGMMRCHSHFTHRTQNCLRMDG